ncbi:metal ABC transporter solute-binding protein, Zn/Mn family [Fontivita pretiosa]|uniref:metal ABC transporter solute-binding protein, Zn/Mn family n=1 Tax=Fontivita pretiosa TaxID=2989684 RepID=UPI003D17D7DC
MKYAQPTFVLLLSVVAIVLGVALLSACGSSPAATSGKPRVVATTTMIGDLVRRIAQDRVELKVIMPPGVDPHTFKPSTADLGNIQRANLVLYNGLHLEGKMVDLLEHELGDRAVAVTRDIPPELLLPWKQTTGAAGGGGAHDPHVWFDASLWARAAKTVCDALVRLDPEGADVYTKNYEQLRAELDALHVEISQKLAEIPKQRRVLITSHDAYNYFGRAYDIEVFGLQGISTETEAGLTNINNAVDFILQRKIPAIFVESSVSPKTIERVQADCKSRGFDVKIGGELYSDAMGSPGERPGYAVETYAGMVRYNVDTIVKALK